MYSNDRRLFSGVRFVSFNDPERITSNSYKFLLLLWVRNDCLFLYYLVLLPQTLNKVLQLDMRVSHERKLDLWKHPEARINVNALENMCILYWSSFCERIEWNWLDGLLLNGWSNDKKRRTVESRLITSGRGGLTGKWSDLAIESESAITCQEACLKVCF